MVKNYQGARIEKAKTTVHQPVSVEDYMTSKLVTFKPDDTIHDVIDVLLKKRISGGPVVDEKNHLIGIISEGDCLKEIVKGKYNNTPSLTGKVEEHMAKNVKTIAPETNVFEAARMFLDMKLRRFPVVKNGKLLGQISQKDVMRAVQNLKSTTW
ncbi:MAG: CBS domain-containing protein [Cyclobacteriaceae bacterium]|nr:CBS domain-containing protein [Cyclobacteriaceae bacterium]